MISKVNDIMVFLFQTYQFDDTGADNPYRQLEKCQDYGFLQDGTTHWATGINTVFVCAVADDGSVYKVPFWMKKVPGSFTGEALCMELISEISSIKKLIDNAATKIAKAVRNYKSTGDDGKEKEYRDHHLQLKAKIS